MFGMDMILKMLSPQLKKLGGVITDIEKSHNTKKALLVMQNEFNVETGKEDPVLMLMGYDDGKMHLLKDKEGKPQKFSIEHLGTIIAGGIDNE